MSSFALDLQKFAEKAKGAADLVVGEVLAKVVKEIDQRSPVGDTSYWKSPPPAGYVGGRFRANWALGVDRVPSGTLDTMDPQGTATVEFNLARIPEEAAGKVYTLVNNLPYAQRIEEGHSRQAPQGLVQLTAIEFQSKVDEAVAGLPS